MQYRSISDRASLGALIFLALGFGIVAVPLAVLAYLFF